ncbi:MAG TPA: protein kinase family protein [Nostocaceae cyanobacterium]|nr:protein kinase family protein [Nostocaceae cyanobacterium]
MAGLLNFQSPQFVRPEFGETIVYNGMEYFIGSRIGRGYFGEVYHCWDEWGNELVAKILVPRNQTYEDVREQWLEELNKLVLLRHPNITFIYAAFEYRHTFYLIMERCDSTLEDHIKPSFQGEDALVYIAREILQGVDFIHDTGYVHKDIHPGNIFVKIMPSDPPLVSIKIGDLGISNLEGNIDFLNTRLAAWMLPPEYLNPEQYGRVGKQTDIYHTALLLLSVLLGYIPQFTHQEILDGKPRHIAESLSSRYGKVIANALCRHVAFRTQTALDFWREIFSVSQN